MVYARAVDSSARLQWGPHRIFDGQYVTSHLRCCSFTVTISATVVCNTPMFLDDTQPMVSYASLLALTRNIPLSLYRHYCNPPKKAKDVNGEN
jgi:hypothetical protein